MEYIPGQIHVQKEHFFLLNGDFCWINCGPKRYSEMNDSRDFDETESIELKAGDTIVVRYFKSSPTSNVRVYLEKVIYLSGEGVDYNTESIISLDFIEANCGYLFTDVTNQFIRDRKLHMLLEV